MLKAVLIGLAVDAIKFGSRRVYGDFQFFNIFQQAISAVCSKYEHLEKIHLVEFFSDKRVSDEMDRFRKTGRAPDYEKLEKVFQIILDEKALKVQAKEVLADFFNEISIRVPQELQAKIQLDYLETIIDSQKDMTVKLDSIDEKSDALLAKIDEYKIDEAFDSSRQLVSEIAEKLGIVSTALNSRDPYYKHVVLIDGKDVKYSLIPRSDDASKIQPLRGSFTIKVKEKDGRLTNLEEMLKRSGKMEEVIFRGDEIEELEIYRGDTLIESIKRKHISELKISPVPPPPHEVNISVVDSKANYTNVLLSVDKFNDQTVSYSNVNQRIFPVVFFLELYRKSRGGHFKFSPNMSMGDIVDAWRYELFIHELARSKKIAVSDSKTNKPIFIGNFKPSVEFQEDRIVVEYFRRAAIIQQALNVKIPWPLFLTREDVIEIDNCYQIISRGSLSGRDLEMNMAIRKDSVGQEEMVESLRTSGFIENIEAKLPFRTNIFGTHIEMGNGTTTSLRLRPKDDPKTVLSRYDDLGPNQSLDVTLESFPNEEIEFRFEEFPKEGIKLLDEFYPSL